MMSVRLRVLTCAVLLVATTIGVASVTEQKVDAAVPRALVASATGSGSVTVSWTAPLDKVNDSDYSYTVRYRTTGSSGDYTVVQTGNGILSAVINQLDGGQSYEFKVTATPQVGDDQGDEGCSRDGISSCSSAEDAPVISFTAQEVPDAPTITSATASSGQIEVAFTAGNLNGSTLTQYTASCGSASATGTSTPVTVTGLTNGVAYTCTVTAGSNQGDSAASSASSSATPSTVPDTMLAPSISAGDGQATVTWTQVSATDGSAVDADVIDDGGTAVTGYTVSIVNAATGTEWTTSPASGSDSSATITGLTNGTAYKAKVKASNANGDGDYSELSSSFTPASGGGISDPLISITTQPAAVNSGVAFTSAPKVSLGTSGVTVTATVSSGSGTLANATAVTGGDGVATFSALTVSISGATASIRLTFSATGYQSATSGQFTVTKTSTTVPGGGGDGSGGGGGGTNEDSTTTSTTIRATTTTVATRSSTTTTIGSVTQTTQPSRTVVAIPAGSGTRVATTPPAKSFATGTAVATKPGSVTIVLDAPNLVGKARILSYKIVLTPIGGGKSVTKVVRVPVGGAPVAPVITGVGGIYKIQVSAIRVNGKSAGTWTIQKVVVKKASVKKAPVKKAPLKP